MEIGTSKEYIFNTQYGDLSRYNGTKVLVMFSFTKIPNQPNLYRAMFVDGRYYDVFEYELCEIK